MVGLTQAGWVASKKTLVEAWTFLSISDQHLSIQSQKKLQSRIEGPNFQLQRECKPGPALAVKRSQRSRLVRINVKDGILKVQRHESVMYMLR